MKKIICKSDVNRKRMDHASDLYANQEYSEALDILQALTEADPENAEAWNDLGVVHFSINKLEDSEKCFIHALKADRHYRDAFLNLSELYKYQNRPEEAEFCLKQYYMLLNYQPTSLDARTSLALGWMYYATGRYELALENFQEALPFGGLDVQVCLDLYLACRRLKNRNIKGVEELEEKLLQLSH